jgi:DNA-binding CsgD family transcriptional regulator/tetratricopeptide (TPR) repeat protein
MATPFVGRQEERRALGDAIDAVSAGAGALFVIEARAGLGKTALVDWCLDLSQARGIQSLVARADPFAAGTPFALAAQFLPNHDWSIATVGDVPPQPGVASGALFALVEGATDDLERVAVRPTVLVVEDLHWADPASIAVVSAAVGLANTQPLLVLVTTRPETDEDRVGLLARAFERPVISSLLMPLTRDESRELVAATLGGAPGPNLAALVDRVSGNPLLLVELLRSLESEDGLRRDGDVVETDRRDPPPSLRADVNRRLRQLGADVVDVVRSVAVLGPHADVATIVILLDRRAEQLAPVFETAHAAGFLDGEGDRFVFRHDLLREAVYLDIPSPTRVATHRRIADMLARRGHDPAAVAAHMALGASPGDEAAVRWLASTAERVRRAAPSSALALVDRALELSSDDQETQKALQRARLDLLIQLGRGEEAATLARTLLAMFGAELPTIDRADLAGRAAGLLVLQRRADEGVAVLDEAIRVTTDEHALARLLAQRAMARVTVTDIDGATRDADQAIQQCEKSGDAVGLTIALAVAGRVNTFAHDYRSGLEPGLRAVLVAEQEPSGEAHLHLPCFHYALSALDVDDLPTATRAVRRGRAAADRLGHAYALPFYCGVQASIHHRRGELDDSWSEATAGLGLARDTGSYQASMWCAAFRSLVALLRGDLDEAREYAASAEEAWAAHSTPLGVDFMTLAVAGVAVVDGDRDRAFEILDGAWRIFGDIGVPSCQPLLGADLVRLAVELEMRPRAAEVASELTDVAARSDLEAHRALAAWGVGLVEGDTELLREATRRSERAGRTLDAMLCRADTARVAHRAADPSAPQILREACVGLDELGAVGTAQRLRDELGGASAATPQPRARFGWESLTPAERAIVALVAEGLTNADIAAARSVSRRTVESQLVRVYTKLGISNRVQLALKAVEHLES